MKNESKLGLKIWGFVWIAIFVSSSFAFLVAQISTLFDDALTAERISFVIVFIGSYFLTLVLMSIIKGKWF